MLDSSFINRIAELAGNETLEFSGRTFTTRQLHPLKESRAEPLEVANLQAIVNYLGDETTFKEIGRPAFIHICNHEQVKVLTTLYGPFRQRETLLVAKIDNLFKSRETEFSFGRYLDNETFIVALQSLFVPTEELAKVLALVGNIRDEAVATHSDDGVTQSVTAKAGVALVKEVAVPNPVTLKPWRTFREIDQPESKFILRLQRRAGSKPECALFEADGGAWKIEAMARIALFFDEKVFIPFI